MDKPPTNLLKKAAVAIKRPVAMSRRFCESAPRGAPNKDPWDRRLILRRPTRVKRYFAAIRFETLSITRLAWFCAAGAMFTGAEARKARDAH